MGDVIVLTTWRPQPKEPAKKPPTDAEFVNKLCKELVGMRSVRGVHDRARKNLTTAAAMLCQQVLEADTLEDIREVLEDFEKLGKVVTIVEHCVFERLRKKTHVFRLIQQGLAPSCETKNADYNEGLECVKILAHRSKMLIDFDKVEIKHVPPWGDHAIVSSVDKLARLREQQRETKDRWSLFDRPQPSY